MKVIYPRRPLKSYGMQPIKVGLLEVKSLLKRYSWHVAELPERESVVGIGGLIIGINDSDPIDRDPIDRVKVAFGSVEWPND